MAGTGRIYRRGHIYYIAYRWDGREYRESARSSDRAVAERLLATRLAERRGSGAPIAPTFDVMAAGYLDDYAVRRLRTLDTARGRVAHLNAAFGGWAANGDHDRRDSRLSANPPGGGRRGSHGEPGDLGPEPDVPARRA